MASTRIVIGIVVTAASSLVALAACSGSTSNTGNGDGGASSSGTSGSGTSGGTSGSGTSGGSAIKQCAPSTSTCSETETNTYSSCIQEKCDATFTKCYGADYKSGTFSGDCGSYITCTQACACGDNTCLAKCTITDACKTCIIPAAQNCSAMCTAPACLTGGSSGSSGSSGTSGGGGSKTCADLKACCDKIPAGQMKDNCNGTYDAIKTMDSSCNAVYASYAPSCP
jgi:hypothetical protein